MFLISVLPVTLVLCTVVEGIQKGINFSFVLPSNSPRQRYPRRNGVHPVTSDGVRKDCAGIFMKEPNSENDNEFPSRQEHETKNDVDKNTNDHSEKESAPQKFNLSFVLDMISSVFYQSTAVFVSIGLIMNLCGWGYTFPRFGDEDFGTIRIERLSKIRENKQFAAQYRSYERDTLRTNQ